MPIVPDAPLFVTWPHDQAGRAARALALRLGASGRGEVRSAHDPVGRLAPCWCVRRSCFPRSQTRQEIMSATKIPKIAFTFALYITVTMTTLATAQEGAFSEGERLGLAACLSKCPDNDKGCNNRCISNSQTKGRVWGDDVRACIRDCRVGTQMKDQIFGCITGCRLDRIVR
jgi:hypothetical protein